MAGTLDVCSDQCKTKNNACDDHALCPGRTNEEPIEEPTKKRPAAEVLYEFKKEVKNAHGKGWEPKATEPIIHGPDVDHVAIAERVIALLNRERAKLAKYTPNGKVAPLGTDEYRHVFLRLNDGATEAELVAVVKARAKRGNLRWLQPRDAFGPSGWSTSRKIVADCEDEAAWETLALDLYEHYAKAMRERKLRPHNASDSAIRRIGKLIGTVAKNLGCDVHGACNSIRSFVAKQVDAAAKTNGFERTNVVAPGIWSVRGWEQWHNQAAASRSAPKPNATPSPKPDTAPAPRIEPEAFAGLLEGHEFMQSPKLAPSAGVGEVEPKSEPEPEPEPMAPTDDADTKLRARLQLKLAKARKRDSRKSRSMADLAIHQLRSDE